MKFTAKTETLRKAIEVLEEIGAKNIEGFTSNVAQDIGDVLLARARAMKQQRAEVDAAKKGVREQSRQISQGKPLPKK